MPKVTIDGTEYEVREGCNMLEAALDNGLDLPYFCWHPAMGSVGACRLCAVKVYKDETDAKGKIQMACMTPAREGTRMSINDPEAAEFRRYVIEWLMTNHPHDCPVCDEGGECHLQDMTTMCGQVYRRFRFRKRTYNNQYLGPLVNHELNRCIQCYRCVRFYRDLAGGQDLNVFASKNRVYFGRQEDGVLESEFSGNLVEVCPTGVFTDKTYDRHYTRKWDLETAPSVCIHCGLGCNTIPGARYDMLRRVTARFSSEVNGYFLCDRGRYGYEFVNSERRVRSARCGAVDSDGPEKLSCDAAMERAKATLGDAKGVVGIGSPRASLEDNFALRRLVGRHSFSTGLSEFDQQGAELALKVLKEGPARTPSLAEVEQADVVVLLGVDPTNEAPMLDFAIRQAMRKAPLDIARKLRIHDWDANAVATALQNAKGKLYAATPWRIKLEDIGGDFLHVDYPGVAGLADQIWEAAGGRQVSGDVAARAADDLREARHPLIVTSISAGTQVVAAAANLAWAICAQGKDCWLTIAVPEANTMGVAMTDGMTVDAALERIESGDADTLVVLANDLSRRVDPEKLGRALSRAKNVIALDSISTGTTERADVLLPASAWAESDGTFVNNECRAQRFYQVFVPAGEQRPAWQALRDLDRQPPRWSTYEDVLAEFAAEVPELAGAVDAAPPGGWRSRTGQQVARMPHRYSGRTAKDADKTILEPRPPVDDETPFAFSMEGVQTPVEAPLVPRFWYPGWNSEQSINKFQIEVGGPLHGGPSGKRLVDPSPTLPHGGGRRETPPQPSPTGEGVSDSPSVPEGVRGRSTAVTLIPRPRIYGSEELSRLAQGLGELTPASEAVMRPEVAERLGVADGQRIEIETEGRVVRLPVRVDDTVAEDVILVPANFDETAGITSPVLLTAVRAE